jgi:membrane-associated protease RseP (regulator of RpoE activity)
MRSFSNLSKITGIILVVAILALGGFNQSSVQAGAPAQTATAQAGDSSAVATAAAGVTSATTAATMATGITYPPCPPAGNANATASATATIVTSAATAAGTTEAAAPTAAATANTNPGYLGVRAEQLDDCGVLIDEVVTDSPAAKSGIQAQDVVVALDGVATPAIALLRQGIQVKQPGDTVVLTIQRSGQQMDIEVTLGVRPPDTTGTVASGTAQAGGAGAAATAAATQ